jgi:hypothetical protein
LLLLALPVLAPQEVSPPEPAYPAPSASAEAEAAYKSTSINFGVGATLPPDVDWKPLTAKERQGLFVNDTFLNPRIVGANTLWATFDMSKGEPREWRQGVVGYGMRLGSRQLRSTAGNSIHHGVAAALKLDVRYLNSKSDNTWKRLGNAAFLRFFTKNQNGNYVFDIAGVGGVYAQEMIGTLWMPGQTITGFALRSANQQMVAGIVTNVVREFLPEIKRAFRKKPNDFVPPSSVPPPAALPASSQGND